MSIRNGVWTLVWLLGVLASSPASRGLAVEVLVVSGGRGLAEIVADVRGAGGDGSSVIRDAAQWLSESVQRATGVRLPLTGQVGQLPAIIIARADAWPDVAGRAGLIMEERGDFRHDAYCVVTEPGRVYLLGNSEDAARYAVAELLHSWGFRWYAPSPRWWIAPQLQSLAVDLQRVGSPALAERRIWYAYGMPGDLAQLQANYTRWAVANRLNVRGRIQTGHSYGNMIGRNAKAFAEKPELYALLASGQRDSERAVNARKFCYSNPALIDLVAADRIRLLEERRRADPAAYMVSVDPSDGEGTCHCDRCAAVGSTSDRVFHLANAVARRLRARDPSAWVGLYAYSSHRLPPNIDVEPNVYVQVAMGFNKTPYSLPELVDRWAGKVGAIGLREYYGVEAWDWGLPGRMRGGQVEYHRKWIPYYAQRKLNAINAETNANWGGQSLGLHVAAQLMWDPEADVTALEDDYLRQCFGDAAVVMRRFYDRLASAPQLRAATLLPLFEELESAWQLSEAEEDRARLNDLMAYLVYVVEFRTFDLVRSRQTSRNDAYYEALGRLMRYTWQIRQRDMVHYYALARRLCNGLPVQDQRPDYYMFNKQARPVWMEGEPLTDDQVRERFLRAAEQLRSDDDPVVSYSRLLNRVRPAGADAGASGILSTTGTAVARFRGRLTGYLVASGQQQVALGLTPTGRQVELTVEDSRGNPLFQQVYRPREPAAGTTPEPYQVLLELPRANEYRTTISGDCVLHVPPATPFVFEASVTQPAWISYSGPHYFYVPKGTRELLVDANPRLSLAVPGRTQRLDLHPADRKAGTQYIVVPVPEGGDGRVWHTTNMTRGQVALLNVPPLLSFHRETIFVPREVAEADGLTTAR